MSRSKYDEKAGQMLFFYVSEERGVDPTPPLFLSFMCASTFIRQRGRETESQKEVTVRSYIANV